MSLIISVFMGFVVMVLASPSLRNREAGVLAIGFLFGGLIFSWLLGAFDVRHGWFAVAGHALGMAGLGYLVFRGGSDRG
jgi:ABC-type arginine transport system permease subunit